MPEYSRAKATRPNLVSYGLVRGVAGLPCRISASDYIVTLGIVAFRYLPSLQGPSLLALDPFYFILFFLLWGMLQLGNSIVFSYTQLTMACLCPNLVLS
ncbi:hypothetical protein F5B21DRAFT_469823 [Xylaria acuta]|nr:hypothetical protein F5B21DRAFT_469823 [Xylaria acuta]